MPVSCCVGVGSRLYGAVIIACGYNDADYAVLDPKFKIPLDKNLVNNSKVLHPSGKGIGKWAARLGFYFQNILGFLPL